jgi:hypothetical protein
MLAAIKAGVSLKKNQNQPPVDKKPEIVEQKEEVKMPPSTGNARDDMLAAIKAGVSVKKNKNEPPVDKKP